MDHRLGRFALIAAGLLAGCGSNEPSGPQAADIVVAPEAVTLVQQATEQLTVSVVDESGTLLSGVPVTFESSDEALVTVSKLGVVTSVGPAGSGQIVVRGAGLKKEVAVTVTAVSHSISISPDPGVLPQKGTLQLEAVLLDLTGTPVPDAKLNYKSGNLAIATVSTTGLVTSVGPAGQVTITVASGDILQQVVVAVTQVATELLVQSVLTVGRGRSLQVGGTVVDAVGVPMPDAVFTYSATPATLLQISTSGLLTAADELGDGSVTIQSGPLQETIPVHVVNATHPAGTLVHTTTLADGFSAFGVAISASGRVATSGLFGAVSIGVLPDFGLTSVAHEGQSTAIAFGPDDHLYVSGIPYDGVTEVSPTTGAAIRSLDGLVGTPFDLVVSPDGKTIYLGTDGHVYFIDAATLTVQHDVEVGGAFVHLALHPGLRRLYASPQGGPAIIEIDTDTREQRPIPTAAGFPQAVAVSLDGTELYVANEGGSVEILTIATGATAGSIPLDCGGYGMARTPDGVQLYVTCSLSNQIEIIDIPSRTVVGNLTASGTPRRVAVSADGATVVVANEGNTVDFIQ